MREKNLAFSVSGGAYPYQMGIAYYIQKNFDLTNVKFSGASGGSWPACLLAAGIDLKVALAHMFEFATPQCQGRFGAYGIYDRGMRATFVELFAGMHLPSVVNGRLAIPVTRVALSNLLVPYLKEELITDFIDNDDVISAIIASSLIPFLITGSPVSIYRNWICVDAGLTNAAGVRRVHDILVDTMLVTGQSNPDFGLEGARGRSKASSLALTVTSEPYGVYNLTLMTVKTIATSIGHMVYNLASSPKMMDTHVSENPNESVLMLSPRSFPPGYPHVRCEHTLQDGSRNLFPESQPQVGLPFPYPNKPIVEMKDISPADAPLSSTQIQHDDSRDASQQSVVCAGDDDGDDSRYTADQSTTTCSSDEFSFLRVKENATILQEGGGEGGDDAVNTADTGASRLDNDDVHNTSNILNVTDVTALMGDLDADVEPEPELQSEQDHTTQDTLQTGKKGRIADQRGCSVNRIQQKVPVAGDASTASTSSLGANTVGVGGMNAANKSYASWVSDDFTSSVYFDSNKKQIYNCNPTPSKIDVESGSVLLLDETNSSQLAQTHSKNQVQSPSSNSSLSTASGSVSSNTRRLSIFSPIYTCIDMVQYFLPSTPAKPNLLPLSSISGTSDPTLARSMLQYVYKISEELRSSIVTTPVTAIRSVGSLMSYVYNSSDSSASDAAPATAGSTRNNNSSSRSSSSKASSGGGDQNQNQNVAEISTTDISAEGRSNMSSQNLHDPGEKFVHTVKAFDRSMYWTTKAKLITKTVRSNKSSKNKSGKGSGVDEDETITGLTMEIAPWTWRHHPLHHFHLTNDTSQLDYLFELGIHDAFVHHAELAEFFNANLDDL